jgi:hypothetical protein
LDRVSVDNLAGIQDSLRLIRVESLRIELIDDPRPGKDSPRILGEFLYLNDLYRLWVTDPEVEDLYRNTPQSAKTVSDCCLTISLGERMDDGYCYKLIAGVINRTRAQQGI